MEDIQIFIVFHKHIFDECYKNIADDVLYKYFTFVGVNEKIPKSYNKDKYKVINEWELPIYDKTFQERGYNENSAIYHVYANNLHKDYKYIGFFQYDMMFNDNIIRYLQSHITETPICFYLGCFNFKFCSYESWHDPYVLNLILKDYEEFHNKPFTKEYQYPLYNSYVIPVETYENAMKWITQFYSKLYPLQPNPGYVYNFSVLGGIYERIMGYAIGEENLKYIIVNVSHNHDLKKLSY